MSVSWNLRRNLSDKRNQNTLPWMELSVAVAPKAALQLSWLCRGSRLRLLTGQIPKVNLSLMDYWRQKHITFIRGKEALQASSCPYRPTVIKHLLFKSNHCQNHEAGRPQTRGTRLNPVTSLCHVFCTFSRGLHCDVNAAHVPHGRLWRLSGVLHRIFRWEPSEELDEPSVTSQGMAPPTAHALI